jgi:hypothetical protein
MRRAMTEFSRAKALCSVPFAADEPRTLESELPVVQAVPLTEDCYGEELDRDRSRQPHRCTSDSERVRTLTLAHVAGLSRGGLCSRGPDSTDVPLSASFVSGQESAPEADVRRYATV